MGELQGFSGVAATAGQGRQGDGVRAQGDGVIGSDHALVVRAEAAGQIRSGGAGAGNRRRRRPRDGRSAGCIGAEGGEHEVGMGEGGGLSETEFAGFKRRDQQRTQSSRRNWQSRVQLFTMTAMPREAVIAPKQEILRTAGRLFQQRGYDATSMNDVAAALKLSKGGLYHHFQSKDEILFEIMNHAMDITQERVINPVREMSDPEERLRSLIRLHIEVVLSPRDREITVMLHENHPLPPALRKRINSRKKEYVHFLETLMGEVQQVRHAKGKVSPRAAAFALLE